MDTRLRHGEKSKKDVCKQGPADRFHLLRVCGVMKWQGWRLPPGRELDFPSKLSHRNRPAERAFQSGRVSCSLLRLQPTATQCNRVLKAENRRRISSSPASLLQSVSVRKSNLPRLAGTGQESLGRSAESGCQTRWKSWCPRRDSNSQTLRRRILNPLRLPFRHSGHRRRV